MSSGSSRSLILVSNWKEDTSLPKTEDALCCLWLPPALGSSSPELLPDAWAFPKPGSRGHWPQGSGGAGAQMWPTQGSLRLAWRRGSRSRASPECHSFLAWPQPEPEEEIFGSGGNYANYLSGSCLQKYPDVGLQIRRLSWGNLCSLFDSGSSFCKHWRPGFHSQAPVRLSLAVSLSQRAILLWDVGC